VTFHKTTLSNHKQKYLSVVILKQRHKPIQKPSWILLQLFKCFGYGESNFTHELPAISKQSRWNRNAVDVIIHYYQNPLFQKWIFVCNKVRDFLLLPSFPTGEEHKDAVILTACDSHKLDIRIGTIRVPASMSFAVCLCQRGTKQGL